jgi:hypothetical protein
MPPRRPNDPRMYTSIFLLEDWQESPQPCGCKIERQEDNPKEAVVSLCLIHTFAPRMFASGKL